MTAQTSKTYNHANCCVSSTAVCTSAQICAHMDTDLLAVSIFALRRLILPQ